MKQLGQLLLGLAVAIGSFVTVVGALMLSLAEGNALTVAQVTLPSSPTAPGVLTTPLPGDTLAPTPPAQHSGAATATRATPQPTICAVPFGWMPYVVQAGDRQNSLAERAGVTSERLSEANCLFSATLLPGTILYLPHAQPTSTPVQALPTVADTLTPSVSPTVTRTVIPCGPPRGWVRYTVQPQDNLYRLSQAFGVSVSRLQQANCLAGTLIRAGQRLYVPNVPTITPEVEDTEEPQASDTPEMTDTPVTPSPETPSPTVTETSLPSTSTDTPSPDTETPTAAPLPSEESTGEAAEDTPPPTETLKSIDNP